MEAIQHFSDTSKKFVHRNHVFSGLTGTAQFGPRGAVVVQGTLLYGFTQGGIWMHRAGLVAGFETWVFSVSLYWK